MRLSIAACVLVATVGSTVARADLAPAAREHLEAGAELIKQKQYARAIEELKLAYGIDPAPDVVYAWAQAERLRGDCPGAIKLYKEYLGFHQLTNDQRGYAAENLERCRQALVGQKAFDDRDDGVEAKKPAVDLEASHRWELRRHDRAHARRTGWILAGAGGALAITGGIFLALEQGQYASVQNGGFGTVGELNSAISTAHAYDKIGIGALCVGGAVVTWGIVKVLLNRDPGELPVQVIGGRDFVGVGLVGALP